MRAITTTIFILWLVASINTAGVAAAEEAPPQAPQPETLAAAMARVTAPLPLRMPAGAVPPPRQAQSQGWIKRHNVLFGAIVGAGGGAVYAATANTELFCDGGDEDCLIYGKRRALWGAAMGAGIGALTSKIVGLFR